LEWAFFVERGLSVFSKTLRTSLLSGWFATALARLRAADLTLELASIKSMSMTETIIGCSTTNFDSVASAKYKIENVLFRVLLLYLRAFLIWNSQ